MAKVNYPQTRAPDLEKRELFISLLRAGNYVKTACDYCGIAEGTLYQWLKEAEQPDSREWVSEFAQSIKEARAGAQAASLQVVQRAANNGTWQAAAWFLERSNPHQWALTQRHQIDMTVTDNRPSARDRLNEALEVMSYEIGEEEQADVFELPGADGPSTNGDSGGGARPTGRRPHRGDGGEGVVGNGTTGAAPT